MEHKPLHGKGPHLLLWVTRGKIQVRGITNSLNYSVIFMVCTYFTFVTSRPLMLDSS